MSYEYVRLTDICEIERAVNEKIYPPGTCYIQISACAKNSNTKWHITERHTTLPNKYAVVLPKVPIIPEYLKEALEFTAEEFFCRYIGSNINIQIGLLDFYTLPYYSELDDQRRVVEILQPIKDDIAATEKQIKSWQDTKEYFLEKMMSVGACV